MYIVAPHEGEFAEEFAMRMIRCAFTLNDTVIGSYKELIFVAKKWSTPDEVMRAWLDWQGRSHLLAKSPPTLSRSADDGII